MFNYHSDMGQCFSLVVVVSKKKSKKKKKKKNFFFFFFTFLNWENQTWYWEKKVTIFDWEWGQNSAPTGLEKSTRPLVFTSASGCRASETLDDFQCKLTFFPYMPIIFVMQGKCIF